MRVKVENFVIFICCTLMLMKHISAHQMKVYTKYNWFKTTSHIFSEGKCEKSEGNWWFRKIQNFVFDLNTIHAYNWNKMILPIKWRFILSIIDSRLLSMYFLRLSVRKVRVIDSKTSIEWIKMLNWAPSELPSYFHF